MTRPILARYVENEYEQFERVELMASDDSAWDLSDNDIAALRTVLRYAKLQERKGLRSRSPLISEFREGRVRMYKGLHTSPSRVKLDSVAASPTKFSRRNLTQDRKTAHTADSLYAVGLSRVKSNCGGWI